MNTVLFSGGKYTQMIFLSAVPSVGTPYTPPFPTPNSPLGTRLCFWSWTLGAAAGIGLLW